jgi:phage terminase small subunit
MTKQKLTAQQEKFKNNILSGMDAKAAYIAAGYKARGATAEAAASRLLRNVKVMSAIEKAQKRASKKAEITQQRILEEEARLAFLNPQGFVNENGKLLDLHELPEDVARAIVGLEIIRQNDGSLKYKYRFTDKGKSLERLSRHLGMYNDKLNLGFNAETLNAILSGLPEEYATAVREALGELVSSR